MAVFLVHGASFLALKTTGEMNKKAKVAVQKLWIWGFAMSVLYLGFTFIETDLIIEKGWPGVIPPILAIAAILGAGVSIRKKNEKLIPGSSSQSSPAMPGKQPIVTPTFCPRA